MPEQSLLTEDVRALIGRTSEATEVEVSRNAVRRAMDLYLGHHERELVAGRPVPGFVLAALQTDGDPLPLPDVMPNSLLVSNEMSFERQLLLGERLTVQSRIADVSERFGGKFGYSLYFRTDNEFRDASGALVAKTAQTMMYYDASAASGEEER